MSKKIAINGFGRIGRLTTRILTNSFPEIEIVAVNDLTSPENLAYLLKYDTTYRKFNFDVRAQDGNIIISTDKGDKVIKVLSERDPANLPWKDLGVDTVIESTGFFTKTEDASKHLTAGARRVVLSAPAKSSDIPTVVLGVNNFSPDDKIISNASCTTNCVAPILKVLTQNFQVENIFAVTNHAYTATQPLQDGPTKKDFRDGRAGAVNAIPSSTGAAKAVELVLPSLKGKLSLSSLRIPVITGSSVYVVAQLKDANITVDGFNAMVKEASQTYLKGILEYTDEAIVSSDIIANPHSSIFDSKLTQVLGNTVNFVVWYDNEWGYSNRLAEVAAGI